MTEVLRPIAERDQFENARGKSVAFDFRGA
jgi:hypothetical protein